MRSFSLRSSVVAFVVLLAVGMSALLGCGRTSAPTRAVPTLQRPGASATFTVVNGVSIIPGHAVVRLTSSFAMSGFVARHDLEVVERVTHEGVTYLLVRSPAEPNALYLPDSLRLDLDADWTAPHMMVAAPEAEWEPMVCDDGDGFKSYAAYVNQGSVQTLELASAHEMATGAGVRVAILDTGLDGDHLVFSGMGPITFTRGLDYTTKPASVWTNETQDQENSDGDDWDDEACGHGTHVAGIVRLAAPDAFIVAIRVLDDDGWGTAWGLSWAIVEAVEQHDADIINFSLGMRAPHQLVEEKVQWASSRGVVMTASAGNRGRHEPQWPAAWEQVISVTAVDDHDRVADFANIDETVDFSAPGVEIASSIPGLLGFGEYATLSGGSAATPWVSGAAALLLELQPALTPVDVAAMLREGSTSIGELNPASTGLIGSGRVNLYMALRQLQ